MDTKIIDKVLEKKATPEEAALVAQWFATKDGQEYLSERYDRESYLLNEETINNWPDIELSSDKMKNRFISQLKYKIRRFRFRFAAAVLIPFLLITGTFLFIVSRFGIFSDNKVSEITVPYGDQIIAILQDGTTVQLNSGSKLEYPEHFGLFSRNVKLSGEGYFCVKKELARPFLVNLNNINIKVTGTKFNAKAYSEDNYIAVSLEEGSVNIVDNTDRLYKLKAGQNAVYNKETGICSINKVEDMTIHTAWKTRSLNFNGTPLKEVLRILERQYDVNFYTKDSTVLDVKFTISTSRVNINDIVKDLEKISKIKFLQARNNCYIVSMR